MLNAFASYKKRKQAAINKKMASLRKAKERKRIESEPPDYPADIDDSIGFTVVRRFGGITIEDEYLLINRVHYAVSRLARCYADIHRINGKIEGYGDDYQEYTDNAEIKLTPWV